MKTYESSTAFFKAT